MGQPPTTSSAAPPATVPLQRTSILRTHLPQPLIIPPRNHGIFTSTEMQQQNLHHFFSGGQPSAPVPLPAAKKRGRPREKAPEPVNPSRIKDPRGGDRKSSKFKAANQIPPVGNSGSSSLHRAVSAVEESATKRAKEDLPPAASSEPNVQSEPAVESPQQPPLPSHSEIAAN